MTVKTGRFGDFRPSEIPALHRAYPLLPTTENCGAPGSRLWPLRRALEALSMQAPPPDDRRVPCLCRRGHRARARNYFR
jgi:rhodanese-related sulfurtransferase